MSEAPAADLEVTGPAEVRPGRALAEARVRRSLSVADVALQLKLSVSQIEALEADAYDRLPGAVFVRGFVRNYARLLELDAEELVATLELEHKGTSAMAAVPRSHNIPFPARGRVRWPAYLAVLLLLIVTVVVVDLLISAPPPAVIPAQPVAQTAPVAAPAAATVTVEQPREAQVAEPVPVANPQGAEPAPAKSGETPAAAAAAASGQDDLHFAFSIESWVEVRDRNDRILMSQLNPAGSEQHVQGRPPFSLVVGNARGVRLTFNGRAIDLAPHTRVEVARLTLE